MIVVVNLLNIRRGDEDVKLFDPSVVDKQGQGFNVVTANVAGVDKSSDKVDENNQKIEGEKGANAKTSPSLRKYFDDRNNGLLVIESVIDESGVADFETGEIKKMKAEQKLETDKSKKFSIVEIKGYDYKKVDLVSESLDDSRQEAQFKEFFIKFIEDLLLKIQNAKPSVEKINNDEHYSAAKSENKFPNREGRIPLYGGHWREQYANEPIRSKAYLLNFLRLSKDEVEALKKSHAAFLEKCPQDFPKSLLEMALKNSFMKGDGIVYLGGGKYNQLVLLSLSLLRSTGSKLPVEVILPKRDDFDIDLCNNILPKFNGKCKIMADYLPALLVKNMKGFQLKNLALLVSSFKNVLYLDADNLPVKNPDALFVNEPFQSNNMILWPDLWRRATSPHFYEISNIQVDAGFRLRNSYFEGDPRGTSKEAEYFSYHDLKGSIPEASSETGQLLINKEKHAKTLFLSLYYNYYGPDYYYPLFSQGAAGEGDKETFIAAAHKLGLPYYQVNEFNREFGPKRDDNKHEFFGMGQYDPIVDYHQREAGATVNPKVDSFAKDDKDGSKSNYDSHFYKSYSLMFLHANWPKYYVDEMFNKNSNGRGPLQLDGSRRRLYTDDFKKETHGFDFEITIMRHIKFWYCRATIKLHEVPDPGTEARTKMCESIGQQLKYLTG